MHCTGFLAIKCNSNTLQFIEKWKRLMMILTSKNDQMGFSYMDKSKIRIKGLETDLFPPGKLYFCVFNNTKYRNVVVVHNNYIVGHDKKKHRFQNFNLWHYDSY